jgi:hypothetical protein
MTQKPKLACPFIYANGRKCRGFVDGMRLYGGDTVYNAKKVRLWCSEKHDHAGVVSTWVAKERMEFYPDRLPKEIFNALASGEL